ncbi:hypothetical protein KR059_002672 [Drosophila kikkawai]|nr:hypothetical protein KR059_002672 [Drosophila kikkawai]
MSFNHNTSAGNIFVDLSGPFTNIHFILRVGFLRTIIDVLALICTLLPTAVVAWTCLRLELRRTAYHALYSTLGLFSFVGGAQMLTCHYCWVAGSRLGNSLHVVLGVLALWTGILGIYAKSAIKRRENKQHDIAEQERHISSKHSWCGLLGYLLLLACAITGVILIFVGALALHLFHRISGFSGFVFLASSQWFSYNTAFARRQWDRRWIIGLQLATLGAVFLVGYDEVFHISYDIVNIFK